VPTINKELYLSLPSNPLKFTVPQQELLRYEDTIWIGNLTFKNINKEDFVFILTSLLLESHMIFLSTNLTLLSSTM